VTLVAERLDTVGFDPVVSAAVISRALQVPGGADLVVGSLSQLPFAVRSRGRSRLLGARPAGVLLADWRYEVAPPGRLAEAHVLGGIVMSEQTLSNAGAGWRVTRALRCHLSQYGDDIVYDILAMIEGLGVACR
jgi:hypothetical protein